MQKMALLPITAPAPGRPGTKLARGVIGVY
jgi:hypothetical protein